MLNPVKQNILVRAQNRKTVGLRPKITRNSFTYSLVCREVSPPHYWLLSTHF